MVATLFLSEIQVGQETAVLESMCSHFQIEDQQYIQLYIEKNLAFLKGMTKYTVGEVFESQLYQGHL